MSISTPAFVLVALLAILAGPTAAKRGVELNCAIITYGDWDWALDANSNSRCIDMVKNARANCGGTGLNFIPTHFWVGVKDPTEVDYYCYKSGTTCPKVTAALIQKFQDGMTGCIAAAVESGFTHIELTPHLDDGLTKGAWRNGLVLEPAVAYGGFSYVDIMLMPLAKAVGAAATPATQVYFSMQGEMSATVMRHPAAWGEVAQALPEWVAGADTDMLANVFVGVSTNFNKLCACVLMDLVDPTLYVSKYAAAHATVADQFNNSAIRELYESLDFFGLASYPSMSSPFSARDIENAVDQFSFEASFFGLNITDLIYRRRKRLHFSEYGIGGGVSQTGMIQALTAKEVAQNPYFGMFGAYSRDKDPWDQFQPESVHVATRDFLRTFYNRTVQWLANNGGPVYRVDALFMWNMASWDVLAIYPDSTTAEGSYKDKVVSAVVLAWNEDRVVPVVAAS